MAEALRASATPEFNAYQLLPANWWLMASASLALLVLVTARTWQLYRPE